jgi:anthraniloyl-CoA monooxygenase
VHGAMKVAVLGGGPGGLYSALLLKKADRRRHIVLFEANPAGATYGWGVVFSDRTLASFREADLATFNDITESFRLWDAIEVFHRDARVRSGGHVFAGIGRRELLRILASRCNALGVELRWSTPADVRDLRDFDLIVAADGVHSQTRSQFESHFRPRLSTGKTRYIWFGTTKPFGAFTFIFRSSDHGLFQVHAYPFDHGTSTFIVECEERVWRRAGLDEAGEDDSIAYCEKLFDEELAGHALMSNRSKWVGFITVKNRSWRHGNVVLLGDAAHTAHFTIGSGTKLAMEDAISLVAALDEHGAVEASLEHYESERRPVIERFQAAAAESQAYFETAARYLHLEPEQFAFYLLTRSGRLDYGNLRQRDPLFVDDIDRRFARAEPGRATPVAPPPMFIPLTLRSVRLSNRSTLSPSPSYDSEDGHPTDQVLGALLDAARAGPGLVITQPVAIAAAARISPGDPGLYGRDHVGAWARVAELIHRETATKLCLKLCHAGRRGSSQVPARAVGVPLSTGGWPLFAPSAIPYRESGPVPKEMSKADMDDVADAFAAAARLAAAAGVDMLEVHMGHGYLLGSFISPLSNRRTDAYGGDATKRLRYPVEVLERVRSVWPGDRPLAVGLNAHDRAPGGMQVGDAVEAAAAMARSGCDLIDVLAGHTTSASRSTYERAYLAPYSDAIRNQVRIPTLVSGNITTTVQVNTILAGGRADLCVLDRW